MNICTDVNALLPDVAAAYQRGVAMVNAMLLVKKPGSKIITGETYRDPLVQAAYLVCGHGLQYEYVDMIFKAAGLWNVGKTEAAQEKTRTMESYHIKRRAIDFTIRDHNGVVLNPKTNQDLFINIGDIFKSVGFTWGGDWDRTAMNIGWDPGHIEYRG